LQNSSPRISNLQKRRQPTPKVGYLGLHDVDSFSRIKPATGLRSKVEAVRALSREELLNNHKYDIAVPNELLEHGGF
jgi:hypothetical protein